MILAMFGTHGHYQGGVTPVPSVLTSATAVKIEVKNQAQKSQQVQGQAGSVGQQPTPLCKYHNRY